MVEFIQQGPRLGNQYTEDIALQEILKSFMGDDISYHEDELRRFGNRVIEDLLPHHRLCEKFPPVFEEYSAWGEKLDKIHTHDSWSYMHKVSSEERLIKLGYLNFQYNRLVQFAKLYLFSPSSGLFLCPLAVVDGAAFLIKHKLPKDPELDELFERLTTDEPERFWTSGQWMTEKNGGSDVSNSTQTIAVHISGDKYSLTGYKWFTSTATSEVTFTLARIEGKVSMFLIIVKDNLDKLKTVRLKEKLGTRQLPTAEIKLEGCIGKLVGNIGEGIRYISNLVNITRLYNSIGAISSMRRATAIARDFAFRRNAFGKLIIEHPLHEKTLFLMELKVRGCLLLLMYTAVLLEKVEKNTSKIWETETLRILTPVIKLYTGKMTSEVVKEGMECIGGVGYMENSGIPNLLRDAEIYSIWEGTTNILSLDVLRAINKLKDFKLTFLIESLKSLSANERLIQRINFITAIIKNETFYRKISFEIGNIFIAALMYWHAERTGTNESKEAAQYWENNFTEGFFEINSQLISSYARNIKNGKATGFGDFGMYFQPRFKL